MNTGLNIDRSYHPHLFSVAIDVTALVSFGGDARREVHLDLPLVSVVLVAFQLLDVEVWHSVFPGTAKNNVL